jgi:transposase-like protein
MPYNPKEVRRRKVLITYNILHKQDAGLFTRTSNTNNSEEKEDALQSEESRRRKVLITYNILHKQGAGLTPELQHI